MDGAIAKAVLITGCSTGIGRATAERLAPSGFRVYATARKLEAIEDLRAKGCSVLALDVCDEQSMRAAVDAIERNEGAIGVLVNNAGYSQSGAIETVSMEQIRRQFRDQCVRTRAALSDGASGHASPAVGPDHKPQFDGREADIPRRRRISCDQARG
jgi:NAD(P)-dependent dehydrogenase (short-subunit alcohol dehydrogenase family)